MRACAESRRCPKAAIAEEPECGLCPAPSYTHMCRHTLSLSSVPPTTTTLSACIKCAALAMIWSFACVPPVRCLEGETRVEVNELFVAREV